MVRGCKRLCATRSWSLTIRFYVVLAVPCDVCDAAGAHHATEDIAESFVPAPTSLSLVTVCLRSRDIHAVDLDQVRVRAGVGGGCAVVRGRCAGVGAPVRRFLVGKDGVAGGDDASASSP